MYYVNKFLLHEEDEYTILQNKTSLVLITERRLSKMFYHLEKGGISVIDDSVLLDFFYEDELIEVYQFLLNERLIEKKNERQLEEKEVVLFTNNEVFGSIFNEFFINKFDSIIIIGDIFKLYDLITEKKSRLVYIFMNPFNLKEYISINQKMSSFNNIIVKNIFYYNNKIYLTNFYKKSWRNPCPLCFFSNLESHLKGLTNIKQYNFQTLLDIIYEKNPNFSVEAKLERYDYIPVINAIQMEFVSENKNREIDKVKSISLENYNVRYDYAYHSRGCDCYE